MAEKKMGLVEGVLTDLKIMMDAAPFASGPANGYEFEPTPEYLSAISGPVPLQKDEVEEGLPEDQYQQTIEEAMNSSSQGESRSLQIDELGTAAALPAINVTKLSPDLDSLTVKELLAMAKEHSVVVPTGTRRKEIIGLIKKAAKGESEGTGLVPQADAPQGLQGSLLASFDSAPLEGSNF